MKAELRPTPETTLFNQTVRGTPIEKYWSALGKCEKLERERDEANKRADSKHALWMMELRKVAELEAQVRAMLKNEASKLESDSIVASCNCDTKTPEIQHHKPGCKYRLIVERDEAREKIIRIKKSHEETELDEIESMREAIKEATTAILYAAPMLTGSSYVRAQAVVNKLKPFLP
jgi:hypothetical protein